MTNKHGKDLLEQERVVTLSAGDLTSILEAIGLCALMARNVRVGDVEAEHGRIQGIVEQLAGKFGL